MEQIINGLANQIEYDSRNETLRLTGDGLIKRLECDIAIDEITGGVIVYNAQSELFTVDGKAPGEASGRVRIIIQPRSDGKSDAGAATGKCPPGSAVPLKPAAALAPPRGAAAAR